MQGTYVEFGMRKIDTVLGDALTSLKSVEDRSVNLVLTDPPYNLGEFMKSRQTNLAAMRSNNFVQAGWDNSGYDNWAVLMRDVLQEINRVLVPGGALILFMSAIKVESIYEAASQADLYYKTTGVWHKPNPMPRNMNLHFINSTESWLYFVSKAKRGKFNNNSKAIHDFIELPVTPAGEKKYGKHPTQKPVKLMKHFVELLTDKGDVVLDPFMGSGSTGVAALELQRKFIGIELDKDYFELANKRLQEVGKHGIDN